MRLGLKGALLQRGLSQRGLARLSNIPESRLSSLIRGWADPSPEEGRMLAEVLGVAQEILFDAGTAIEIRSAR